MLVTLLKYAYMGRVVTVYLCSELFIVETAALSSTCLHIYTSLSCLSFYFKQCLSIKV